MVFFVSIFVMCLFIVRRHLTTTVLFWNTWSVWSGNRFFPFILSFLRELYSKTYKTENLPDQNRKPSGARIRKYKLKSPSQRPDGVRDRYYFCIFFLLVPRVAPSGPFRDHSGRLNALPREARFGRFRGRHLWPTPIYQIIK